MARGRTGFAEAADVGEGVRTRRRWRADAPIARPAAAIDMDRLSAALCGRASAGRAPTAVTGPARQIRSATEGFCLRVGRAIAVAHVAGPQLKKPVVYQNIT